jgi:hypothetical protein
MHNKDKKREGYATTRSIGEKGPPEAIFGMHRILVSRYLWKSFLETLPDGEPLPVFARFRG